MMLLPCVPAFSAETPEHIELGPVVYRTAGPFKPYVEALRSPSGVPVVLDSPPDHVHHHALMFGLTADGADFWGEQGNNVGHQMPMETKRTSDDGWQGLSQSLRWTATDDRMAQEYIGHLRLVLNERRDVRVYDSKEATLLGWRTVLTATHPVALTGAHYVGLGMRLASGFSNACRFVFPASREGVLVRGDEHLTFDAWCAASGEVDGKKVTVVMMEHPLNPRSQTRWFTMAQHMAYMSATLNIQDFPRPVTPDSPLDVRYGVAVFDGHPDVKQIDAVYRRWLSLENPLGGRVNVADPAKGATATASSTYATGYEAWNVMDGRWSNRTTDKWNSAANLAPHYVRLDLGRVETVDRVVVHHEGAIPVADGAAYNTADFRVQGSERPWGPWNDLVPPIFGNTDNVTVHAFPPTAVQYVRVISETSEQNGRNEYGRIAEVEVYRTLEAK